MNSQLTYNTMASHHDDMLRRAETARGVREPRRAPRHGAVSLELRVPRLRPRVAWRQVSFVLSTFTTIALVALVVTLSSSRAATRSDVSAHAVTPASAGNAPLGLVRDPRTGAWTCVRVTHRHFVHHLAR